jgi:hypothetical protein
LREVVVGGEGFRLVLKVFGYERPSLDTGADANWMAGEVELTLSTGARFSAGSHVSLRTEELATFHERLTRIVSALDGEAALTHMEVRSAARSLSSVGAANSTASCASMCLT